MSENWNTKYSRGFIGLVSLLVTVLIICFMVWKMGAEQNIKAPEYKGGSSPLNGFNAIDQAKNAKNQLENSVPPGYLNQ
ncbi:hypothetical protein KW790_01705 [Candidatus Parcubacteria bacterium]|nr:hypothetical protein [Candidatus Parcubacteria bacterium]